MPPKRVHAPPTGNPGSAPAEVTKERRPRWINPDFETPCQSHLKSEREGTSCSTEMDLGPTNTFKKSSYLLLQTHCYLSTF